MNGQSKARNAKPGKAASQLITLIALFHLLAAVAAGQRLTDTVTLGANLVGSAPIGINPATNQIYLATSSALLILDGATDRLTTIPTTFQAVDYVVANPRTNKVYFVDQNADKLTIFDANTKTFSTRSVPSVPLSATVDPGLNKIYVGAIRGSSGGGNLYSIDGGGDQNSDQTFEVPFGALDVAVNPATHKVYIASCDGDGNGTDSHWSVFDPASVGMRTTVVAGRSCNFRVAVNPATNRIYLLNNDRAESIIVIDGNTDTVVTQFDLPVDVLARRLAANPVTNKIYAVCDLGQLIEIDGATNAVSVIQMNDQGTEESMVVNSATNQIYVTDEVDGVVEIIDGKTHADTTLTLGGPGDTREFALNPVTNRVYVTQDGKKIFVIDGATNETKSVATGAGSVAATVNTTTGKAYIVNGGNNTVTEINGADGATFNIPVGTTPVAVDVNVVTNTIYVANKGSNNVTVINGATRNTANIAAGTAPSSVAVNSATNQIYVANKGSNDVTVVDGATNTTTTLSAGSAPAAIAVNSANNKIYVANHDSNNVTIIDGSNNATSEVNVAPGPFALGINTVTNNVYSLGGNLTVIEPDGHTDGFSLTSRGPVGLAVNSVTNTVYLANSVDGTISVLKDPATVPTEVEMSLGALAIAVNPTSNKVYVTDNLGQLTIMDGIGLTLATSPIGSLPLALAVDPILNKIYVADEQTASTVVLSEQHANSSPLTTAITPTSFTGRESSSSNPTFSLALSSGSLGTLPSAAFFQVDSWQGAWTTAAESAGAFSAQAPSLGIGNHILFAFAGDGQEANAVAKEENVIGAISAYPFTVTGVTAVQPQIILSATNATVTVTRGGSATYLLSVSAQGNLPAAVTFACGPLPANTTCSFSPASVNATPTPVTVTLTVATIAPAIFFPMPNRQLPTGLLFSGLILLSLILLGWQFSRKYSLRSAVRPALLWTAAACVLFFAGCSSSSSVIGSGNPPPSGGTPTGSFTIAVTSTAGTIQSTTNLTLIVQ